jgi:thiamine kinase-like enzyme
MNTNGIVFQDSATVPGRRNASSWEAAGAATFAAPGDPIPSFPSHSVPVFAEDTGDNNALLRMCPCVKAIVCHIFGLQDDSNDVDVEPITGGLSNFLFKASSQHTARLSRPVLVRVFGPLALDRERENKIFCKFAAAGIGPLLLATFRNGRLEEFLDGYRTLEPEEFLGKSHGPVVAERLARLHSAELARVAEEVTGGPAQPGESEIWVQLEQWLEDALRRDFSKRPAQQRAKIRQVLAAVRVDLGKWKRFFGEISSATWQGRADRFWGRLRLCHNDLHGVRFSLAVSLSMCVHVCAYVRMCVHDVCALGSGRDTHTHTHTHTHTQTHTHTHTRTHTHTHTHKCCKQVVQEEFARHNRRLFVVIHVSSSFSLPPP